MQSINTVLKLGLIGDNIAASRAPYLHGISGELTGYEVSYDLLVPREMEMDFDAVFAHCMAEKYTGINITYPYKELAAQRVIIKDPLVKAMGAVNTIVFEPAGPVGYNTDYSGFMAAYRSQFGDKSPGDVALVGAGGVGRAVAFGVLALGASSLRITDRDSKRAEALLADLRNAAPQFDVEIVADVEAAIAGASALINCTPMGMVGYGGTAIPKSLLGGQDWVFDAVYTPVDTPFLQDARAAGIAVMSGYELFFNQGVHAFKIYSGESVPEAELRARLLAIKTE